MVVTMVKVVKMMRQNLQQQQQQSTTAERSPLTFCSREKLLLVALCSFFIIDTSISLLP